MEQKRITIIIPAYNAEKYIGKCLKAVKSQTYNNFEVIIVDDGSQDKTVSICEEYAEDDNHIRVIKSEHRGVSRARNVGLEAATGELVSFFDADDYPEENLLREYAEAFEMWEHTVSFVSCGMYWENLYDRLVPQEKHILEAGRGYKEGNRYLIQNHDISMLSWNQLFNFVTNKCYYKSVIDNNSIRFNEEVNIAEDILFNLDYLKVTDSFIGVINKPLYHYVKHGDTSLSSSYYVGAIEHVCHSFENLLDYISKQPGVSEEDTAVIKSIYLMDWVSRLSMLMGDNNSELGKKERYKICNEELKKEKFKALLRDSFKSHKISGVRYFALRNCRFEIFYFMRKIYHALRISRRSEENS